MAPATPRVAATKTGAMALGRMWRKMMRRSPAPRLLAATTYSRSLRLRNSARTNRATPIQEVSPITAMMLRIDGSSRAITARIRKKVGKQSIMSVKRITVDSTQPP